MRDAEEGRSPALTSSEEPHHHNAPGKSETYWDAVTKLTLTSTMGVMAAGYGLKNDDVRAASFGLFSLYQAEKSVKDFPQDRPAAFSHALNAVGNAVWAGGTGANHRGMLTAGPATRFVTHLTSAGIQYCREAEGWSRELIDAAEMLSFAAAGYTGSPAARAAAFGTAATGFLSDARQDKGFLGHGVGAVTWAVGAGMESDSLQSVAAGIVAVSEAGRLFYPVYDRYAQKQSAEATPQSMGESIAVYRSTHLAGRAPEAHVEDQTAVNTTGIQNRHSRSASAPAPVNPGALAAQRFTLSVATPGPLSSHNDSRRIPSPPTTDRFWSQNSAKPRRNSI